MPVKGLTKIAARPPSGQLHGSVPFQADFLRLLNTIGLKSRLESKSILKIIKVELSQCLLTQAERLKFYSAVLFADKSAC